MSNPPYRALRALVEIARTGSATAAATHLGITPSAVAHLLADLERQLGTALFTQRRSGALNDTGRRLVKSLDPSFAAIDQAIAEIDRPAGAIRLSTLSSFAMLWLIPRLERLRPLLPGVDILISTDTRVVDLAHEPYDCAIRWMCPHPAARGMRHSLLFHEHLIQVASPRLADNPNLLPRLLARSRPQDWLRFDAAPRTAGSLMFETRGQMIEAALAGLGVAVIDRHLVAGPLASGLLRQIGAHTEPRPEAYVFIAREAAFEQHGVRILHQWLIDEIGR